MNQYQNIIYLVDDSRSIRSFFASALGASGYTVETFENPTTCLESIKTKLPDCILTDYEMPGMSGVEFCRQIKAVEATKSIPVILLSIHDQDTIIIEALRAGADDYLPKSTNPEIILAKLKLMTELKRHREQMIDQERVRTYRATVCSISHELNNTMAILLPMLEHNIDFTPASGAPPSVSSKNLKKTLERLVSNIKLLTEQTEQPIEFETYFKDTEMIALKKAR